MLMRVLFLALLLIAPSPLLAAEFAVVQCNLPTVDGGDTGNNCTVSGVGTPKGAFVWGGFGTANDTPVSHAGLWIGGYDGTNQNSIGQTSGNGLDVSDTGSATDSNSALITLDAAHVKDGDCTASFITDGIRLTCADAPPAAYLVNVLLVGGSGVSNVSVGTATGNASVGGTTAVSAPGFTPDIVLAWATNATAHWRMSFGFATNEAGPTIVQRAISSNDSDNSASMAVNARMATNRLVTNPVGVGTLELTSFDVNGFTVTTRDSASGVPSFGYLAIKLSGLSAKLMTSPAPAGTGSQSVTGVNFRPQFGMVLQGEYTAVDTTYSADDNEVFAISAFTVSASASSAAYNEDSDGTSNTESVTDNKACRTRKGTPNADYATCTLTSFDPDGATFNYTVNVGGAKQRAILFVQAPASSSRLLLGVGQ